MSKRSNNCQIVRSSHTLSRDFQFAANTGLVHLETKPGQNYFFTPLGKSFSCRKAEDQGPMKLYNLARQQIEGSVDMWDTKFQPFVVRAGGSWGEQKPCLDAEIRRARIEFWPFVSAALLILSSGIFVGGEHHHKYFLSPFNIGFNWKVTLLREPGSLTRRLTTGAMRKVTSESSTRWRW